MLAVGRRRGAGLGTQGEAGLWRNWTFTVRARLTLSAGNGVERLVWQHVMDCSGRGTRGKMSEAVEIAQPGGSGTPAAAGSSGTERRSRGEGGGAAGWSWGPGMELRRALERT